MNRVCPICGEEIKEKTRVQSCAKCGAVHHSICFISHGCGECAFTNRPHRHQRTMPTARKKTYTSADSRGIFGCAFKNTGRAIKRMAKTLLIASMLAAAILFALGVYFTAERGSVLPIAAGLAAAIFVLILLISRAQLIYALGERTENSAKMLEALSDIEYRLAKAENKNSEK